MSDLASFPTTPRSGPCSPWVSAGDVLDVDIPDDVEVPDSWASLMAEAATEVCYSLSRRQFTGPCGPVTVRPLARPVDVDTRFGHRGTPNGYVTAGMYGSAYGAYAAAVNHYGTSRPPEVDLGVFPVIAVTQVKIDGIVIPPNEYKLQDRRTLVRMRPTAGATPTARYGWPTSQIMDLPDTEVGTFSISVTYGVLPPATGFLAAKTLARQLLLNALGLENSLPQRSTSVSRQGVSVNTTDVEDFFKNGGTGVYEVDLFVETFNPSHARLPSMVWSPDVGRARRQ